jgi:hypothetical protein
MSDDSAERAPIGKIDLSGLPGPGTRLVDRPQGVGERRLHRSFATDGATAPDRAQSSIQRQGDRRHDPAVQRHLRRAAVGRRPGARASRRIGRGGLATGNDRGGDQRT